jgi:hypothetical protein
VPVRLLSGLVVFLGGRQCEVEYPGRVQGEHALDVKSADLDSYEQDCLIEQVDDVEEAACDLLGDDDGDVLALRKPPPLVVPVLQRADDVALVCDTQLDLHLVTGVALWVLQEHVEATKPRLATLNVLHVQVAEAKQWEFTDDRFLRPLLVELRVSLQAHPG